MADFMREEATFSSSSQQLQAGPAADLNVFAPSRCIVLGELSTRDKEKYYSLLLDNDARFYVDEGQGDKELYVANLRLLAPGVKKEKRKGATAQQQPGANTEKPATPIKERLLRLKQTGYVSVTVTGTVKPFDYTPYLRFVAIIATDGDFCKPKARILSWLMKTIEELYDSRFAHEKSDVERDDAALSSKADVTSEALLPSQIFPVFIHKRLSTVLGLRFIVEQNCWDLLYNVDRLRSDYLEVEIFGRFLQEFYDQDDLLFFLYVRSVIASALHINFRGRWAKLDGPGRQTPQALWMSHRECVQVARIVFGAKNDALCREFLTLITPQMVGQKTEQGDSRRIDITQFLHLAVVGYHQTQSANPDYSLASSSASLSPILQSPKRFSSYTFPDQNTTPASSSSLDAYLNVLSREQGSNDRGLDLAALATSPMSTYRDHESLLQLKADREKEFLDHICQPLYSLIEAGALVGEADVETILLQMIDMLRLKMDALIGQPDYSSEDAYDAQLLTALRTPSLKAEMDQYRDRLVESKKVTAR